ncbi:Uncharacterized protein DAT39_012777 [Clarias magur]|uniref:Uncharacterized protein n=1 Tax=Clarias magur TaxID=1594786 RepID=A0A8J4WZ48_CLAMG|nr:Uncharacterized protein DAT39_012777 [Clarias magur]
MPNRVPCHLWMTEQRRRSQPSAQLISGTSHLKGSCVDRQRGRDERRTDELACNSVMVASVGSEYSHLLSVPQLIQSCHALSCHFNSSHNKT